jgi:hypothetical protein
MDDPGVDFARRQRDFSLLQNAQTVSTDGRGGFPESKSSFPSIDEVIVEL